MLGVLVRPGYSFVSLASSAAVSTCRTNVATSGSCDARGPATFSRPTRWSARNSSNSAAGSRPAANAASRDRCSNGFPSRRAVVDAYAKQSGRDVSNILFHRVLAMLKLGVIFAQIYARYRRGESADARYARFGPIVDGLFAFAHDIARGRAF